MFKLKSNKTFTDIVSGFNTIVEELEDLISRNRQRIEENDFQINQLVVENENLEDENSKATNTAHRIRTLLG